MDYFKNLFYLYIDMSFYIVIGLMLVGILHVYINKKWISKHVGDHSFSSVVKASLFGVPLPLCSCGVVPTAVYLKKNGASTGAVVSFLISTPQTGVDSIMATYGLLGPFMAIYRPIAAFVSGIIGGSISNMVAKNDLEKEPAEIACACGHEHETATTKKTLREKLRTVFSYAFGEFLDDIVVHFIIGLLIAAAITTLIPDNFFSEIGLNSGILAMLIMIVIGLPMYICSTSSIPIAIALILKGFSPGAAFVFLFVGPVTNAASLALIIKTLGKKITIIYLITVSAVAIAFGYLLDFLMNNFNILLNLDRYVDGHESYPLHMYIVSGLFLIAIGFSLYRRFFKHDHDCEHCQESA